ncbi:hypothetical protein HYSC106933_10515 [Hydrogenibacillus schlegelii]
MTDPRVTQEGAALIVMEDGFRALPLLGQNERFGPSSCLKRGPNIRRERDGISDHHAGPMVQNRQKPTLPAAIDKLREIGVEHLKGVRFPFGKKAKGEIRPFGLRFSHLSREGKLKRVEKTPNPLPPPTTLRLRSSASRRRSPDTGCSRRMASLSALRASSARARLFSASSRFFWSYPVARGNQASPQENRQGSPPPGQRLLHQTDALLKRKLISLPCPRKFVRRAISTSFLPRSGSKSRMRFWDPLFVRGGERSAPFSRRGCFPFKRGFG